jgi:epoxyqueuosine reductase
MNTRDLERHVQTRGWAGRAAGIERLADLREDLAAAVSTLDPEVARERLAFYDFRPPADLPGASAIIIVAVPLPRARLVFHWDGTRTEVAVPPAYIRFEEAGRKVQEDLAALLAPAGYRLAPALVPEKLLAARCGLAAYGRNNIAYVPGMGSFLRLASFYSDAPLGGDHWQAPAALPRCSGCRACANACPTQAIQSNRFLLHTERCIVFHNERPGAVPFPSWIDPAGHGCLVGCLECQKACLENAGCLANCVDEGEFSEEETSLLIDGVPIDRLPAALCRKLADADLSGLFGIISRNLAAVLARSTQTTSRQPEISALEVGHF